MSKQNLVDLKDVRFHWQADEAPTLSIESFSINHGDHVFIRGDSGSGKTTLLNLLCGIYKADTGIIKILDQDMNTLSNQQRDSFRGDHLGVIFQQFNLLPYLSVKENIQLPLGFSKKRMSNYKRNLTNTNEKMTETDNDNLNDKITNDKTHSDNEISRLLKALDLPDALINKKVTQLSVGQQQRVAACRALLGSPELIIADEPTSALDSKNRDNFLQLLFKEADRHNSTIIFVSHDEQTAKHFSNVIELSDINQALAS